MRICPLLILALFASAALADENWPPRVASTSRGEAIAVTYISGDATIQNTGHDILVTPTGNAGKISPDR